MALRVAFQMDALTAINPRSDSGLALAIEAQARGYEVWHYTPERMFYSGGKVLAHATPVKFNNNPDHWFDLGEAVTLNLEEMDVVWLRQDPPFDMAYITTTYLLERIHPKTLVVNNPASVRNHPEKWFPTELKQFMPPTLIASDIAPIREFRAEHKDIVMKPLYGHGGNGVFRIKPDDDNFSTLTEMLFKRSKDPWVVQKFLPEMADGERRIILIDGKLAAIAGRIPAAGETRAALRLGAKYVKAQPTKRQHEICEALGPLLKERGLIFTALDVIGDWLTEINLTSPSAVPPINALYGIKLEADIWDAVERYLP